MRQAKFERPGILAIAPKAFGLVLDEVGGQADRGFELHGDAAVVEIRGPLIARPEGMLALFCDSYEEIEKRVASAFESGAARVILRIDSPGGDAAGCFELARSLRTMAQVTGKPFLAYAEGMAASAAYAIACAADEIVVAPTAYVGSIGVFEALVDWTAQTAAQGVRVVIVASGAEKTDRNPDVPIDDERIARVQAQVDQFAGLFFDLVAEMRGGSPKDYEALRGGVFLGTAAIGPRLANRVSAWKELIAGKSESATEIRPMSASKKSFDAAKEALRAVVDDEKCSDDEREMARKSLRALEDGPPKKKDDDEGGESKSEDEKKKEDEAKAKAEEDDKKAKAEDDEKKQAAAQASSGRPLTIDDIRRETAAEFDRRARAATEQAEREALLAQRPDFDPELRAALASAPISHLRTAVEKSPRRAPMRPAAAAAAMASVHGETQGDLDHQLDSETERLLNRRMGTTGAHAPTNPEAMVFGSFDRERAETHIKKTSKKESV